MSDAPPALYRLSVDGEPQVKQRPRFGQGRTYTSAATVRAEAKIAWTFRQSYPGVVADAATRFGIRVIFYCKGKARGDVDNRIKTVLDALQSIVYANDNQVDEIHALIVHGSSQPRSQIEIFRVRPEWR